MDFVQNQLFDGRPFRMLTVVDQFDPLSPLIEPRFGCGGRDVVAAHHGTARAGSVSYGETGSVSGPGFSTAFMRDSHVLRGSE